MLWILVLTLAGLRIPTTQPGYATMTVQAAGDTTVMWTHYLLSNHDDLFVRVGRDIVPLYGWKLTHLSDDGEVLIIERDHRPTHDQYDRLYWETKTEYRVEFVDDLIAEWRAERERERLRMRLDFDGDGRPGTQSDFGLLQLRLGTRAQPGDPLDLQPDGKIDELDVKAFEQLRGAR